MTQPFGLASKGGLYTSISQLEMLGQPGIATILRNFEVDSNGGYRRINGFTQFGENNAVRPEANEIVQGVYPYADGVVVCVGENIYFSIDGESWLQINKAAVAGAGDDYATFTGRAVATRANQGQTSFVLFEGSTFKYGELIIADGANKLYSFRMEGTGDITTRTFFANEITVDGTNAVKYITIHDHHLIAAGVENNLSTVYYSVYNDPDNFTGAGAGAVTISDQIRGIKGFRENLIVFTQNSLHKLININDTANIRIDPITENVGCISGYSIQEIGGDLLFLSPDGLRTIAGTARIGDVELGSVSRPIRSILENITNNIDILRITSTVIRSKSQYRLFYSVPTGVDATADSSAKGIIATLTTNGFQYAETLGIKPTSISSAFTSQGIEKTFHGDADGYIYNHDKGFSFNTAGVESKINAAYQTPSLDFGDAGTRKTVYYVKLSISPEGEVQPSLRIRFDYEDPTVAQPLDYLFDQIPLPSILGTGRFGTSVFGAPTDPLVRKAVQGSGSTVSFIVKSNDTNASYTVNGMYIDYSPSGRR
jgi:hypothetical protein